MAKASVLHEAPLDIMRERPDVLLEVLALAKVNVVGGAERLRVVVADSALTELPSQRNADFVAHVHEEGRARPRLTVIVEVQRGRRREKKYAWSEYVVRAARRHGAPVVLLVWVFDARTARWARGPHKLGPGFAYSPVVIGPEELPAVGSVEAAAAHLDLATLVALTRLGEAAAKKTDLPEEAAQAEVLRVAAAAVALSDEDVRDRIATASHGAASVAFRGILEQFLEAHHMRTLELLKEEFREEGREKGREEGEARGRAKTLLRLLRLRGFTVEEAASARIAATTDVAQLDRWLDRVLTAKSVEEVLVD
ncbi:MAG: hypothetical protein JNL21_19450 [Myxococcales bacterium]|nr:hypothetical protein [Myxococcales bacterium]